jgi:hypothetical protein
MERIRPVPQAANRRILPRPAQKPGGRRRIRGRGVAAAAEGRTHADVAVTTGLHGADLAGRTVTAVRAVCQPSARRAAVDAVARQLGRAGADAGAAGPARTEGRARLGRAAFASASTVGAGARWGTKEGGEES